MSSLSKTILLCSLFFSPIVVVANQVPDYAMATMLATKAKGLVAHRSTTTGIESNRIRLRRQRGSIIDDSIKEASCGGVAIGNVRPIAGDHRNHNVTIVVTGNVVNTGNKC